MGHEESFERREDEGMTREELFAPLDAELAASFPAFGRLEEQGTRREKVLEGHEVPSEWEGVGGMGLAGQIARRLAPALFEN